MEEKGRGTKVHTVEEKGSTKILKEKGSSAEEDDGRGATQRGQEKGSRAKYQTGEEKCSKILKIETTQTVEDKGNKIEKKGSSETITQIVTEERTAIEQSEVKRVELFDERRT